MIVTKDVKTFFSFSEIYVFFLSTKPPTLPAQVGWETNLMELFNCTEVWNLHLPQSYPGNYQALRID